MTAIRPIVFGLAMAAAAAFGTDFILQKRSQTTRRAGPTAPPTATSPTTPSLGSVVDSEYVAATPPAASELPQAGLDLKVGERAMSLPLKEGALDSFLSPGSLIDVLATIDFQGQDGKRRTATTVVAEGARVLAVHDPEKSRSTRRPSITVAVSYQAAGAIELASTKGSIAVVARSKREPAGERASQVYLLDLVTDPAAAAAAAAAEAQAEAEAVEAAGPQWSVRVIRGAITTEEGFGTK